MTATDVQQRPHESPDSHIVRRSAAGSTSTNLDGFVELRVWAESYWDAQQYRIDLYNRLGLKANGQPKKDGANVDIETASLLIGPVVAHEQHLQKMLVRTYRRVVSPSVIAWQRDTFGVGDVLLARLLGQLGHPRVATPYHWEGPTGERVLVADPPYERSLRQLWAYCGVGAPERRRKGMTQEDALALGNPRCKTLLWRIACATMKCRPEPMKRSIADRYAVGPAVVADQSKRVPQAKVLTADQRSSPHSSKERAAARHSPAGEDLCAESLRARSPAMSRPATRPFRALYDQRRAHTTQTHPEWTDGHRHADALRILSKEILRDLWTAAQ